MNAAGYQGGCKRSHHAAIRSLRAFPSHYFGDSLETAIDNDSKGGPADPEAAPREFLSDLVARAAPTCKEGAHRGGGGGIPARRLDEERRGPGADAEHRASLEDPGLRTRQGTRRGGEEFPGKTAGGSIQVRLARRPVCEVPRRWTHVQIA